MADDVRKELSKYINVAYVEAFGGTIRGPIAKSGKEEIGQSKTTKRVLYLGGHDIGLPLIPTNLRYLAEKLGGDADQWVGTRVELFLADTQNPQGKACKGVRVRLVQD